MKKPFLVLSAIAAFYMTSCKQELMSDLDINNSVEVTFSIGTENNLSSRAIGDEILVDKVACAVFDVNGRELKNLKETVDITYNNENKPTATFSTRLAKGHNYRLAFFAYKSDAGVYNVDDLKNITIDTEKLKANDKNCDAFSAYYEIEAEKTIQAIHEQVTLKRPFAQLNFGIDEDEKKAAEDAGIDVKKTQVIVSNIYKAFSAYADEVVGEAEEILFNMNDIPEEKFELNGKKYSYIAMNYLLVRNSGSENSLTHIVLTYETSNGDQKTLNTFYYVPVQRNYRTNILGKLLTSSIDIEIDIDQEFKGTLVSNSDELKTAIANGGTIKLTEDITPENTIDIKAGVDVYLDLNGKTIAIDPETLTPNSNGYHYAFIIREGGSLTIDGDGTVEATTPAPILFYPAGDLVIESGTFIRNIPEGYEGNVGSMFVGTKPAGGWETTGVTINGGYFDPGYYPDVLKEVDIEKLIEGEETLVESEDEINKRGMAGDPNAIRKALKELCSVSFNSSNNYFKVYGGTFVGANPAWGDEGCMLPKIPYSTNYLQPWSYYQRGFLEGQIIMAEQNYRGDPILPNLPDGYSITKGTHEDGRPIYTVNYSKKK